MMFSGSSDGSCGPGWSPGSRGFRGYGGSCESDWLGESGLEGLFGSCECFGLVWDSGPGGSGGLMGFVGLVAWWVSWVFWVF